MKEPEYRKISDIDRIEPPGKREDVLPITKADIPCPEYAMSERTEAEKLVLWLQVHWDCVIEIAMKWTGNWRPEIDNDETFQVKLPDGNGTVIFEGRILKVHENSIDMWLSGGVRLETEDDI